MKWKRWAIILAVVVLAAGAILVLRMIAAKQSRENDAELAAAQTKTETAAEATATTAASDAPGAQTTRAAETKKDPTFAFTVSGSNVYATVQGGEGQTKFDAEKNTAATILPTAGEMIIE